MADSQTPSSRVINDARKLRTLTDADGRKITFRALTILDQARLFKAIGPEQAQNQPYVGLAVIAASVVDIDGTPSPWPHNPATVDGAIGRLGDSGYLAYQGELERELAALTTPDDTPTESAVNAVLADAKN